MNAAQLQQLGRLVEDINALVRAGRDAAFKLTETARAEASHTACMTETLMGLAIGKVSEIQDLIEAAE